MTSWTLIFQSLRFHARSHLGVVLGAAVGSAALVGALVVGDSVRESLHDLALARLGKVDVALAAGDRLFRAQLGAEMSPAGQAPEFVSVLQLPGTAVTADGSGRANHAQILGVDANFWKLANQPSALGELPADAVVLNDALAEQLKVNKGNTILLRVQKPSLLSRDAPISPQSDMSVALRLKVQAIISDEQLGRFGLQANQIAPFNAFVNLAQLQEKVGQPGRANLMLRAGGEKSDPALTITAANAALADHWQLADAELSLRELPEDAGVELRSRRVFLDPAAVDAAKEIFPGAEPVLTYFVNELRSPPFATPYSMVTAMGAPVVPADMRDNEILLSDWAADDLSAKPGEKITLKYFVIGNGRALEEREQEFTIRGTVPMTGAAADRGLMPDFPGLAEADSSHDWDAGFPIDLKRIRPKDEQYWKQYRGIPKAFVTLAAGSKMWANRFGDFTAMRFPPSAGSLTSINEALRKKISPASVGLGFQPVREQALAASSQAVDFGGLFLGFSFFLIAAALLLMGLLFQFGLEQRAVEIGTLLALGFRPRQVRRLFLGEGVMLALAGGIIGAAGGVFYAQAMLLGLTTIWRSAVGTSALRYHATLPTLVTGAAASTVVAALTIWLTLRRQARRPARELLAGGSDAASKKPGWNWKRNWGIWTALAAGVPALGLILFGSQSSAESAAEIFFGAGALWLIGVLGISEYWLAALGKRRITDADSRGKQVEGLTLGGLGVRGCGRRRKRSLATIGLLACGVFLIVAIGAFRVDANADANLRSSGTGGFALLGETALPVTYDLNSAAGREFYGLDSPLMKKIRVVAFRVHEGDEASCLNLNRAQQPRLLGVDPGALQKRQAFTFAEEAPGLARKQWTMLWTNASGDEIPAVGDENSILWAMGKKIGDTVDYTDSRGRPFKVRLVGALANSVLQGNLIIDEAQFVKKFPDESGYRMFLLDAASNNLTEISTLLTRALQDVGLELTPAAQRLNRFNAVQNTYLSTFQVLGGLGLLLGSAGLGVVVLRNVQERRSELALLLAVGFRRRALHWLVLSEHGALLGWGAAAGIFAAGIAVAPSLLAPGARVPGWSLALTLFAVLANGFIWTWLATRFALRGKLLDALRNE